RTASITLDLPQPLGPTMPTSCPGVPMEVGSTNDLKPASLMWLRRNGGPAGGIGGRRRGIAGYTPALRPHPDEPMQRRTLKAGNYSGMRALAVPPAIGK